MYIACPIADTYSTCTCMLRVYEHAYIIRNYMLAILAISLVNQTLSSGVALID